MKQTERFILKPVFGNLKERGLQAIDTLVYIAMRSTCNKQIKTSEVMCTTTMEEIATLCKLPIEDITDSVKRLSGSHFITPARTSIENATNGYIMTANPYQRIPRSVLGISSVSPQDKGNLVALLEYNRDGHAGPRAPLAANIGITDDDLKDSVDRLFEGRYILDDGFPQADGSFSSYLIFFDTSIEYGNGQHLEF